MLVYMKTKTENKGMFSEATVSNTPMDCKKKNAIIMYDEIGSKQSKKHAAKDNVESMEEQQLHASVPNKLVDRLYVFTIPFKLN